MDNKQNVMDAAYLAFRQKMRATQWLRILKISLSISIAVLLVFALAGSLFKENSIFTVSMLNDEGKAQISLSETADFANATVALDAGGMGSMTNISELWLPDGLDSTDGSHNGENYFAYTFYVKNVGDITCDLTEIIHLDSAVLGADAAIRVRLYRNGRPTTYAKVGADGVPETGTRPFESEDIVCSGVTDEFAPGQINKYTLVIWLEGDDPECLDNIKGGNVKMSMTFTTEEPPQT